MKKTYFLILSLFFALGATQVFSQELASLLRSDTIAVVHLNLKDFDFDRLVESKLERIDSFFENWNYDEDSREAICREAKTLITGKLSLVRPLYQMFVMATRLDEVYLISYANGLETVPMIVATPLEGKSNTQIALLESFFANAPIKPFHRDGFLILAVPCSPDKGPLAVAWIQNHLESEPMNHSAVIEAFDNMSEDTIVRAVAIKPENLQELLDGVDLSQVPPQVMAVLNMVLEKFQWVSFGFDVYAFSVELTVQTSSEEDAEELLELFKVTQDAGIEMLRIGLYSGATMGSEGDLAFALFAEYIPLLTEIARGAIRKTLPEIDGTRLIFSCP